MKITKIVGKGNDLTLLLEGFSSTQVNTLRRIMMNEVPVMAIEDVEFKKNNGILYDEMVALRLGLIPLSTDLKGYNMPSECTCKGAGCAKCQVKLSLSANGPCVVYAKDLKSSDPKIKPVYPEMPIVKLLEGQGIELVATAMLGVGKTHAKWSTGLVHYRKKPSIKISNDIDTKAVMKVLNSSVMDVITEKKNKLVVDEKKLLLASTPDAYEDISPSIKVEYSDDEFIFIIESWGQLSPKEIVDEGFNRMQLYIKELEKLVKAL